MNFTDWTQAHRRSLLFLIVLLVVGGIYTGRQLPVSLFPRISFPRIEIDLDAGDRPADRMAVEVTRPVEEAVRGVPGVVNIRSTTTRGSAAISVRFEWGQDMVSRMLELESAVNQIRTGLPGNTTFTVRRMDPTVYPVLAYSLTSDTVPMVRLRDIAYFQLRPILSAVSGVRQVGVQGGEEAEFHVTIDPMMLASFGLTLDEVASALSASNVVEGVGRVEDHYKLYLVVSDTRFENLPGVGQTVLRSGKDGVVLLEDVATVSRATVPRWTRVTADGHEAVTLSIYQQRGADTVKIDQELKAKLNGYRKRLPSGVTISKWYDQSELILSSEKSVRDAIVIGVLLAGLVLLVFLRNLKVTLIALVAVPSVLAATVVILFVFDMSFNIMTLGGMAAAVGLIIDDTVVMMEHIMRRLREGEGGHHRKVMAAAREFSRPLMGSSASTIIIFLPLTFLSGLTGAFFKSLSLTMAGSLFISFIITWLAEPLLADYFLGEKDAEQKGTGSLARQGNRAYEWLMQRLLVKPWWVFLGVIPLLAAGWYAYNHVGSGFMPSMDEGGFVLDYRAPAGTSLTETDRLLRQVAQILQATPSVRTYTRRTGLALGGTLADPNEGDFFILLKGFPRPPIEQVMADVREKINRSVPGLEIEISQLMEDLIGDLTAAPQPIDIRIYSDNEQQLLKLGPKVAKAISKVSGVVEIKDGIVYAGDALQVKVDRNKAAFEGMDPGSVTQQVQKAISGEVTTQIQIGPKMVGVRLWMPEKIRQTVWNVRHLELRAPDGHMFPLQRIAEVKILTGQPQIKRDNLKRMIAVTARISGRSMGGVIPDIRKILDRKGFFPETVYYELGGLYQQQQIAFAGLLKVFFMAVLLVFFLLLFLYESFRKAAAILATTLLATAAVFIGLWLTGIELNITSMMGMTMIVGIVTEVGIFYASEYTDLAEDRGRADMLIAAGINRMRPILMTTLAAILALFPLALGIGQGAAMQQPLAVAIISGLIAQFPLVLIVLPAFLMLTGPEKD